MKLTKREKALLSILVALVIVGSIVTFGIMPQISKREENAQKLQQNESLRLIMETQLAKYGKQDEKIKELENDVNISLNYIMKNVTSEMLDDQVREMTESAKVTIDTLSISDPAILPLDQYPESADMAEDVPVTYPIREYLEIVRNSSNLAEGQTIFSPVYLVKRSVTIKFFGSFDQISTMVDLVRNKNTTLYVEENAASYNEKIGEWEVQLVLGAYYYESQE